MRVVSGVELYFELEWDTSQAIQYLKSMHMETQRLQKVG